MRRSTHVRGRRRYAPLQAPMVALALLAGSASIVPVAAAQQSDDESAVEAVDGAVVEGEADDAGAERDASRSPARPRWIEPRRGEAASDEVVQAPATASAAPRGDWRVGTNILVHGEPPAERLGEVVEARLRRLGAETIERRAVGTSASTDQVRYFHAEDASKAAGLAAALEPVFGRVRVRDLTDYRPAPPLGSLEVWLR